MKKKLLDINVFDAAMARIEYIFDNFEKVYVSFSGGKDSGVMIQMALEVAKRKNRLPLDVLFVDTEAHYSATIDFVEKILRRPDVKAYWVCLPINLRNAVSQYQTHWTCWEPAKRKIWVRDYPQGCIHTVEHFPFFRLGMGFEDFVVQFGEWLSDGRKTACMMGCRSAESLNRYRMLMKKRKTTYDGKQWTRMLSENLCNTFPIYDWRSEDDWIAYGKMGWPYNKVYDLMYMAGLTIYQMRLCQPYGEEPRRGLYLFKKLDPDIWEKIVNRVEGANFGNRYSEKEQEVLGMYKTHLPEGHTYESYAKFLLETMPRNLRNHYLTKINHFLKWWENEGISPIPDCADLELESKKKAPSWRRICKTLLKNDYWCTGLSFSPTKRTL